MSEQSEVNWVELAKQGDQEAFAQLVRLYEKRVLALALRMCGDPEDAAEAAQDAFLSAWQGLAFFRQESSFSTWLYRLTSNACVDLLRREGRRKAAHGLSLNDEALGWDAPDHGPGPHETLERQELREQIEAGLAAMTPEHRQVLVLRELHQLSYEEIAQVCELDVGTVKSRISRGRKQLRKYLCATGNFFPPSSSKDRAKEGNHGPM